MNNTIPLLAELEAAIARGSPDRRAVMLAQITDFFVEGSMRLSEDEIALFDDVITRLAAEMEVAVRERLARTLAPNPKAPPNISRILANDDEIRVAEPVLTLSERLDDGTLMGIARKKGEPFLLAITQRKSLSEDLTDVLVERGTPLVLLNTAKNAGARFSQAGFAQLVVAARADDALATCVGSRPDIPQSLLLALIDAASERVRDKLTAADRRSGAAIDNAVTAVKQEFRVAASGKAADQAAAQSLVHSLRQSGKLTSETIRGFAEHGKWEEIQATLSLLCEVPIEVVGQASAQDQSETFLVLAKAADLSRSTAKAVLSLRTKQRGLPASEIDRGMASFDRLNLETARQIVQFYSLRKANRTDEPRISRNSIPRSSLAALEHPLVPRKH